MIAMQKIDLTGKWLYEETFDGGKARGLLRIHQQENTIRGVLEFEERLDNYPAFRVKEHVSGQVNGYELTLSGTDFELFGAPEDLDYCLDSWQGVFTIEKKIVGSSQDADGNCGIFVLQRKL